MLAASQCTENIGKEEENVCVCTEAMMNFHSLLKSTVICAVLHYILSKMS